MGGGRGEDGGKTKKKRGGGNWKQGMRIFEEAEHGTNRVRACVCVCWEGAESGSWVSRWRGSRVSRDYRVCRGEVAAGRGG